MVLKNYSGGNTHDITVKNCVFWTDLAQSMEIGAETNKSGGANAIYNAIFEDIDVIHSSHMRYTAGGRGLNRRRTDLPSS